MAAIWHPVNFWSVPGLGILTIDSSKAPNGHAAMPRNGMLADGWSGKKEIGARLFDPQSASPYMWYAAHIMETM